MTTSRNYCIINSSLYSYETYTQVKEMDNLNLFIDSHYKYIVSIIRVKHILTLHLSTATEESCPLLAAAARTCVARYAIYFCLVESIPQFLELWPVSMHFDGTLILLYFIEMLPRTVSTLIDAHLLSVLLVHSAHYYSQSSQINHSVQMGFLS